MSFERRQITRTPSSSESAPVTTAAATSPIECPITAPGRTPRAAMASARATCMAKIVGWTAPIPVTVSGADMASVTENPDSCRMSGSMRAMAAANVGSFASRGAPISAHCEPCPENTHTGPRSSWPTAAGYGVSPAAISRRPAHSSLVSPASLASAAMTAVRTGRCPRRRASVYPRSFRSTGSP